MTTRRSVEQPLPTTVKAAMSTLENYAKRVGVERMAGVAETIRTPQIAMRLFEARLVGLEHECFAVMFLDTRHRMIALEEMFRGTVDGAAVYPREVAKRALELNAAAVIVAHNHPSGNPEPSRADEDITRKLREALELFDIRLLDHMIVAPGSETTSFASRGLI